MLQMRQKSYETQSSRSSKLFTGVFGSNRGIELQNGMSIHNLNGAGNKSTLQDIPPEDDNFEENVRQVRIKNKTGGSIGREKSLGTLSNESDHNQQELMQNKSYLEDFKKYVKIKQNQQIQTSKVQFDEDNINSNQEGYKDTNKTSLSNAKVKQSTMNIMKEIRRKLKLQNKSKADKFEESMAMFKGTETYIEIKPFLEQLNMLNHQKYIQEISKYEKNIQQAKEYQEQDEFIKKVLPPITESTSEKGTVPISDQKMRKFRELLIRANQTILKSDSNKKFQKFSENLSSKLLKELGFKQESDEEDNNNTNANNHQSMLSSDEDQDTQQDGEPLFKTEIDQQQKQMQKKIITINKPQVQKKTIKAALNDELDAGDLANDDNQFFNNLQTYLRKAQKEINLKNELDSEMNTYALIIQENQKKIHEAKLHQLRKFGEGQLDPEKLFEEDKNIIPDKYYERYREKAEQVRNTLNKVNSELFNQKWANAKLKRKMERQKERNKLLTQFKGNTQGTNMEDLLNPSKKMNDRILKRKEMTLTHSTVHRLTAQSNMHRVNEIHEEKKEDPNMNDQSHHLTNRSVERSSRRNSLILSKEDDKEEDTKFSKEWTEQSKTEQTMTKVKKAAEMLEPIKENQSLHSRQAQSLNKLRNISVTERSLQTEDKNGQQNLNNLNSPKNRISLSPSKQFNPLKQQPSNHPLSNNLSSNSLLHQSQSQSKLQFSISNNKSNLTSNIETAQSSKRNIGKSNFNNDNSHILSSINSSKSLKLPKLISTTPQAYNNNSNNTSVHNLLSPIKKNNDIGLYLDHQFNNTNIQKKKFQLLTPTITSQSSQNIQDRSSFRMPQKAIALSDSKINFRKPQQFANILSNNLSPSARTDQSSKLISSNTNTQNQLQPENITNDGDNQEQATESEEQLKMEQLLQDIEEERQGYQNEKQSIKNQLNMMDENYDREMQKFRVQDNMESLRGITSTQSNQTKFTMPSKSVRVNTRF